MYPSVDLERATRKFSDFCVAGDCIYALKFSAWKLPWFNSISVARNRVYRRVREPSYVENMFIEANHSYLALVIRWEYVSSTRYICSSWEDWQPSIFFVSNI